jgi:hypothetical protein
VSADPPEAGQGAAGNEPSLGFVVQNALEHALRLSYPRRVGTKGEHRARREIRRILLEQGWKVEDEPFRIRRPVQSLERLLVIARLALVLLTLVAASVVPLLAAPGAFLVFVTLVLPFLRPVRSRAFRLALGPPFTRAARRDPRGGTGAARLWGRRREDGSRRSGRSRRDRDGGLETANLVATMKPPAGAGNGRAVPRVILCAHYDTKEGFPLGLRLPLAWAALLFAVLWVAASLVLAASGGGRTTGVVFGLTGGVALALHAVSFLPRRGAPRSPGAADNASGLGVLLEWGRVLAARSTGPGGGAEVTLLVTSAEELGLLGAAHHARLLDRERPTLVVNFDTVGLEGKLWLAVRNGRGPAREGLPGALSGRLDPLLREIAGRRQVPHVILPFLVGASADHVPFGDEGFPAMTLGAFGKGLRHLHTSGDVPANLHREGFDRAGLLVTELLARLDSGRTT